ncbi:MAG: Gfo/Idh/MocA family oxidoreductase, partial [Bacteroidota bacterium]
MNVAIIGCGLIGRKRALAFNDQDVLVACCDSNEMMAEKFSSEFSCTAYTDHKKLLEDSNCDAVVVSVVNKYAKEIITDALIAGKHVLAEKPLGRNFEEAREIVGSAEYVVGSKESCQDGISASLQYGVGSKKYVVLKTGFNHRFHPAIWKAKQIADEGKIGKIFNIRARYGHGGRQGMEKEWRASKDLSGGGELLDQGVHVIDLIRWFGGEVREVFGNFETKFWDMEVEDNAFAILKTENNVTASFHVSWTNWKNIFSFEIFGTNGYLKVEGLGGSYGPETLEFGKRKKEGGRPEIELFEFPNEDVSWKEEWKEFKAA